MQKQIPIAVKVFSILYYISAGFSALLALGGLFFGSKIAPKLLAVSGQPIPPVLGTVIILISILALLSATLNFFVARGLWRGLNWARIYVIVVSIISVLGSLMSVRRGGMIISLALSGAIAYYLIYDKPTKKHFNV
jgi:hypothetical protein